MSGTTGIADALRPLYEVKAELFKGLAHPIRIRILEVLADAAARTELNGSVSVGELLTETGLEASHLSQHLSVLRQGRLVASERRGSQVFYRLATPAVADLLRVARTLLGERLTEARERLERSAELPEVPTRAASIDPTQQGADQQGADEQRSDQQGSVAR